MSSHDWGYGDQRGPDEWPLYYPVGKRQSPINILVDTQATTCCSHDENLYQRLGNGLRIAPAAGESKRTHLDSIGEENQRSPSANSSSGVSSSDRNSDDADNQSESGTQSDNSDSGLTKRHQTDRHIHRIRNFNDSNNNKTHENQRMKLVSRQNTRKCVTNKKIFLGYPRYLNSVQLCNTGHGWQIDMPPEVSTHILISGPPFGHREYRLAQLHCHWGKDCAHGSEHQINGRSFAAEIHFVHWNCTDFESIEKASNNRHGLAVLAILVEAFEAESNRNKHLDKIIKNLDAIREPNSSTTVKPRLDLKKLFPSNRWAYASYEGSLTTPPLTEVVDWVVFLNPIRCSTSQIESFKKIQCPVDGENTQLTMNCRPIQPVNDRLVSIWSHH